MKLVAEGASEAKSLWSDRYVRAARSVDEQLGVISDKGLRSDCQEVQSKVEAVRGSPPGSAAASGPSNRSDERAAQGWAAADRALQRLDTVQRRAGGVSPLGQ